MKRATLLAATAWAVLLQLAAPVAAGAPRTLTCPLSIIASVTSCSGSGTVVAGTNVTYTISIEEDGPGQFDLVFVLRSHAGDADLVVSTPSGTQLRSAHGTGEDWIMLPRTKVEAGSYLVAAVGSSDHSNFKVTVEKHEQQTALEPSEREALQKVLDGPCCARAGSCSSLRSGLNGFEGITSDLCNAGQNRCDGQGRLIHLALVNEYLSCPFPAEFGELQRLEILDLTMNDLTGAADKEVVAVVKRLPNLQSLQLPHNRLGGQLTCELLGPQGGLASLDFTANEVQGSIPACLVESPAMQELYLSNNRLSGPLPAPPADSKLLIISAHSMRLVGSVPDMSALTQLQALQLQNNGFTGELPPMPASMRNLNLEYNRFSGPIPKQWGSLDGWEVLRLRHNKLTGALPAGLAKQAELELLLVNHNRLTGVVPQDWATPQLLRLDLQHNNLTGTLPAALGALPALTVLQAGSNGLAAGSSNQLQVLALNRNQFDGPVPAQLQRLPLFGGGFVLLDGVSIPATLELSENELSGPFPSWIVEELVDSSVVVNLQGNRLTCPAEVPVTQPLPEYRLEGLDCLAADGSKLSVAGLLRVQPAAQPIAPPASGGDVPDSSSSGSPESRDSGSTADAAGGEADSGSGSSKLAGWAIALITVASVAAAAAVAWMVAPWLYGRWRGWRADRYEPYDEPDTPSAAYAAKQSAVALSELGHSQKKGPQGSGGASYRGGAQGAWGATTSEVPGPDPFWIGTKVHADGAELV